MIDNKYVRCTFCTVTGTVLPMALFVIAGVMSALGSSPLIGRAAAYLTALSLLLMIGTYFLHHAATSMGVQRRR